MLPHGKSNKTFAIVNIFYLAKPLKNKSRKNIFFVRKIKKNCGIFCCSQIQVSLFYGECGNRNKKMDGNPFADVVLFHCYVGHGLDSLFFKVCLCVWSLIHV